MSLVQQPSRIDLTQLRSQIVKTLGSGKARRYFVYLTRLFSHKLSKVEFDKLCRLTIGHENLPLHNHFIQSILKNAHTGKVPPPPPVSDITVWIRSFGGKTSPHEDGYLKSPPPNITNSVVLSNGDLLTSLHNRRSEKRGRGFIDHPGPLGPNETVAAHHEASKGEASLDLLHNGNLCTYDFKMLIHQHQGVAEQVYHPPKKQRLKKSPHDNLHVNDNGLFEVSTGDGHEITGSSRSGKPIHAPLGIPFCSASRGGAYRSGNIGGLHEVSYMSFADTGELLDTETVRRRMEHIANMDGIDGVPVDSANLLNNALDMYLKKLIRSCLEIAKARSSNELIKNPYGNAAQGLNALYQNNLMHVQPSSSYVQRLREAKSGLSISRLVFRVALELNPQQLGEDWPSLLEKITSHSIEGE